MSTVSQGRALRSHWQTILITALVVGFEISFLVSPRAQTSRLDKIRIVERGAYSAEANLRPDTRSPTGAVNAFRNIRLLSSSATILGKVGTNFGIQYMPEGEPKAASVELKIVIVFPSQGLRNPNTQATIQQTNFVARSLIGLTAFSGYQFDHDWEVVPGRWTFEIWHGERLLVEQHFCVYALGDYSPSPASPFTVCEAKTS